MKLKKHTKIEKNFDKEKRKRLNFLANKTLKEDTKSQALKEKKINLNFLELF